MIVRALRVDFSHGGCDAPPNVLLTAMHTPPTCVRRRHDLALFPGIACWFVLTAIPAMASTFTDDLAFLQQHTETIVLREGAAVVAVTPEYQGRVMTSAWDQDGPSLGWLNRPVIEKGVQPPAERVGTLQEHIHVFGGEERLWLGPEGGQFSIFFPPQSEFVFARWKTPACIDTEPYRVTRRSTAEVSFAHEATLQNWSGTRFDIGIERTVRVLDRAAAESRLQVRLDAQVSLVGYESVNELRNRGSEAWTSEGGLLSIWLLGMYPPSPGTTVVIPIKAGDESTLGPIVNDAYFGKVPPSHLRVEPDVVFLRGDGTHRSKIGISPRRSKHIAGSYDAERSILNIVRYDPPASTATGYVNSLWELQDDPYAGDAINAYNDGAPEPGAAPLGPFYELETSSPAAALAPGELIRHVQTTVHLTGPRAALDALARQLLGVDLERIEGAFAQ